MAPPLSLPLCVVSTGSGSPHLVCYCVRESNGEGFRDGFNLCVTDAAELWSTCFSPDSLATLKARSGLSSTEDISSRFRAACQQQAVTVSLQEDRALMTLSGDTSALTFDLSKVPSQEAALRLQALTLSLAERVCNLERRLAEADSMRMLTDTCRKMKQSWTMGYCFIVSVLKEKGLPTEKLTPSSRTDPHQDCWP
ncbi:protein PAXX isoform X4 [Psammomys obesus]|uniref:protein PAXX isoform X4 n=1 Tax=Psammomys obesus TaxID=48139 RepID=UPI002452F74D|nr:protein PAXX isoform X4 [Psammomys obesus]